MDKVIAARYNRTHCPRCGDMTTADLIGFSCGEIFARAIEKEMDDTWKPLVRLDLHFYYTLRDLYQEMDVKYNSVRFSPLCLTVNHVIKQIEFILNPIAFEDLFNERSEQAFNALINRLYPNNTADIEKADDLRLLLRALNEHPGDTVIVTVPIKIILDKDERSNEIPVSIQYKIKEGINSSEEKIYINSNRVCPSCGAKLDKVAGYHSEFIIGLAGLARVGKTTYIASLVHQLQKLNNGFMSITIDVNEKFYKDLVDVYKVGKIITKTEIENTEEIPLLYLTVKIEQREYNFIFVDMPGEIYNYTSDEGADFVSDKRKILKNADVIWCCVEPKMINPKYHNKQTENTISGNNMDDLSNLVATINNIYETKRPAAVIVTQSDLMKRDYPELYQPHIQTFSQFIINNNALDLTELLNHSQVVRRFMHEMNSFEPTIDDVFEGYFPFAIASYGYDVKNESVNTTSIRPSLVELPFLWTLAVLGCLETRKKNINKNMFGKETVTFESIQNRRELFVNGSR